MNPPRLAQDIARAYRFVSVPNISDAMDKLGIVGHPMGVYRLWDACPKIVGTACTMKLVPVSESTVSPVIGTLEAIVAGHVGDVLVIDGGASTAFNLMGGVAGSTAVQRGLVGCVADGLVRDIDEYKALNFPVFARGPIQTSVRNRCGYAGRGMDVTIGGATVRDGDLIVGDENGLLVVPREQVVEVLRIAQTLKAVEDGVIAAVRRGEDPVEAHHRVSYDAMTRRDAR
jgi:regulator of RNase E activity RraA